jgi:hypothetical protein
MTRKDFELVAKTLNYELEAARGNYETRAVEVLTELATCYADTFDRAYPRFDRGGFLVIALQDADAMYEITTPGFIETPGKGRELPWLRLIHAANEIEPRMFGEPILNVAGVEQYEHATVTHNEDGTVTVVAISQRGNDVLTAAARTIQL